MADQNTAEQPTNGWVIPSFLKVIVFLPIIYAFVGVGGLIIYEATRDKFILDNIVSLILALTVFTIPVDEIIVAVFTQDNPDWLKAVVAMPFVLAFVILGSFIIFQATRVDFVLINIVSLMTAFGIFAAPTYKIVKSIVRGNAGG